MLYLAEVQKQKSGFMGAGKAEIKLLALQRADQSWTSVPGDETIPAEEANNFASGTLVLADLNANRQVQRIQEAGRPLISILQNFSRILEKSRRQEEEIEQWKQSLSYQSQELNRRNIELEARLERLQNMEEDFKNLEAQQQEFSVQREETQRLRQELEGAWEHLRGEQRRLAEKQQTVLAPADSRQIQELVNRLSDNVATQTLQQNLDSAAEILAREQSILDAHWQQFEQQQAIALTQQQEAGNLTEKVQQSFSELQQVQNVLEQAVLELESVNASRDRANESAQLLRSQLDRQDELYQQLAQFAETVNPIDVSQKVNLAALEQMPLAQLEQLVQDLHHDLAKNSQFVNDQEEELGYQQQAVSEVQAKLNQASEGDRATVQAELAEEQDRYQMLNETLVGQRQNLRERQQILKQHLRVLWQRQGHQIFDLPEEQNIDFKPLLASIAAQKQQQAVALQQLNEQIAQLEARRQQLQTTIDDCAAQRETKQQQLQTLEQELLSLRVNEAESWGRVNLYQEALQSIQDNLNSLRQHLEAIAATLAPGDDQSQTIAEIRQLLLGLMPNVEMATI